MLKGVQDAVKILNVAFMTSPKKTENPICVVVISLGRASKAEILIKWTHHINLGLLTVLIIGRLLALFPSTNFICTASRMFILFGRLRRH
jgi:hypothetical protein